MLSSGPRRSSFVTKLCIVSENTYSHFIKDTYTRGQLGCVIYRSLYLAGKETFRQSLLNTKHADPGLAFDGGAKKKEKTAVWDRDGRHFVKVQSEKEIMVRAGSRAFSQLIQTIYSYDADVQNLKNEIENYRLFAKLFLFISITWLFGTQNQFLRLFFT
jgi:hypothetical protein